MDDDQALSYSKKVLKRLRHPEKGESIDPALSLYSPSQHLGATSETFAQRVDEYIKSNPDYLLKVKGTEIPPWKANAKKLIPNARFRLLMNVRYMRSIVEPGEAVGLLASQG